MFERIQQRLEALNLTERQASMLAVGNPDLVRNLKRARSRSPRGEALSKLSRVLKVSESWLLGTTDDDAPPPEGQPFGVRFGGIVEAGAFRRNDPLDQEAEIRRVPLPADPRYPATAQYAFRVEGDSMTEAHIWEGMHVLAVDVHVWEHLHGEPGDGKLVVVARWRDGEAERELTVKRLRLFRDRMELRPESLNPRHQPLVFPLPLAQDDSAEARIIAVVLSATWILT